MSAVVYRTRNNSDPAGKPVVVLICGDDDSRYIDVICEDILSLYDCAVYYRRPDQTDKDHILERVMKRMNLLIVTVTESMIASMGKPEEESIINNCINSANRMRVPVLPLIMEEVSRRKLERCSSFFEPDFFYELVRYDPDLNAVPYRTKLGRLLSVAFQSNIIQDPKHAYELVKEAADKGDKSAEIMSADMERYSIGTHKYLYGVKTALMNLVERREEECERIARDIDNEIDNKIGDSPEDLIEFLDSDMSKIYEGIRLPEKEINDLLLSLRKLAELLFETGDHRGAAKYYKKILPYVELLAFGFAPPDDDIYPVPGRESGGSGNTEAYLNSFCELINCYRMLIVTNRRAGEPAEAAKWGRNAGPVLHAALEALRDPARVLDKNMPDKMTGECYGGSFAEMIRAEVMLIYSEMMEICFENCDNEGALAWFEKGTELLRGARDRRSLEEVTRLNCRLARIRADEGDNESACMSYQAALAQADLLYKAFGGARLLELCVRITLELCGLYLKEEETEKARNAFDSIQDKYETENGQFPGSRRFNIRLWSLCCGYHALYKISTLGINLETASLQRLIRVCLDYCRDTLGEMKDSVPVSDCIAGKGRPVTIWEEYGDYAGSFGCTERDTMEICAFLSEVVGRYYHESEQYADSIRWYDRACRIKCREMRRTHTLRDMMTAGYAARDLFELCRGVDNKGLADTYISLADHCLSFLIDNGGSYAVKKEYDDLVGCKSGIERLGWIDDYEDEDRLLKHVIKEPELIIARKKYYEDYIRFRESNGEDYFDSAVCAGPEGRTEAERRYAVIKERIMCCLDLLSERMDRSSVTRDLISDYYQCIGAFRLDMNTGSKDALRESFDTDLGKMDLIEFTSAVRKALFDQSRLLFKFDEDAALIVLFCDYLLALTGTGAKKEKSIREWKEHFKEMPFPDHPVSMITYPGLWIDLTTAMDDLDTRSK